MKTRILAFVAALVLCTSIAPAQIGGGGTWHRHVIIRSWSFTGLSTGACTLPSELQFARALGTNASETVQTGTSTIVTSGLGANQPRCGRRLDADSVGLLFEAARTNSYPYSRDLNNAALSAGSGLTFTGGQTGPDGTANAAHIAVLSGGFSRFYFPSNITGTYVASQWVARGPGTGAYQLAHVNANNTTVASCAFGTASAAWARVVTGTVTMSAQSCAIVPQDGENRSGSNGEAAQAQDSLVDLVQWEQGKYATSFVLTSGTSATRNGDRLYLATASQVIPGGRVNLTISLRPEAAPASYSAAVRVFTSGTDYCEIATSGVLTCSVGGVTNTTTALSWAQYDSLDLWIAVGGGIATSVSYRVNGGAAVHPTVTGSALGAVSVAGTLDLLCNGAASEFGSWITGITLMKSGGKPTWAENDNAIRSEVAA